MAKIMLNLPTTDYIGMSSYFTYMETRIDNEQKIKSVLRESMIKAGASAEDVAIIKEAAELEKKVRAKWDRFKTFINGLADRFFKAMDTILANDKTYLEKYKDTILNKECRDGIEYEYNGDYKVGIDRINKCKLVPFNEARHGAFLRQEGMKAIVDNLFDDTNGFNYEDGTLAEQFKRYFLGMDKGKTKGDFKNFSKGDRQAMYNFCYNVKDLKDKVQSELNTGINQSTNAIAGAARKADQSKGEKTQTNTNNNAQQNTTANNAANSNANKTNTTANTATNTTANNNAGSNNNGNSSKNESVLMNYYGLQYVYEADNNNDNEDTKAGINIDDTNENRGNSATKNAGDGNSANDKGGNAANTVNAQEGSAADIQNITNKWVKLCQAYLSGKMTAIERISKDYMAIIKTHVRSYGGKDTAGNNNQNNQNNNENNNNAGNENNNQQQNQNQNKNNDNNT